MTERDERALREALRGLEGTDPVDPAAARRGAADRRRRRQTLVGVVTVLVLVVGVIGLPRLLTGGGLEATSARPAGSRAEQAPAGGAAADGGPASPRLEPQAESAPEGWRTEYYRDISFSVPASWGYAVPPLEDWCVGNVQGKPRADQRRPYVWLAGAIPVASIACPQPRPVTLLTEHVEALTPGPAADYVEGAVREGDWWVVTRFAGSAVLVVTTNDRARADRILDTAQVASEDAPCPPSSPVAGPAGTHPDDAFDLAALAAVDRVALCQYEPVDDGADVGLPRLRATSRLEGSRARRMVTTLASAPTNKGTCDPPLGGRPDLAMVVRIWAGGESHSVYVNPAGCAGGMRGGIDDGTTVRVLTRGACEQLLTPPIAIWSAGGEVARSCMR